MITGGGAGDEEEQEQEEEEEAPTTRNNKALFHLPPLISTQRLRQEVVTLNGALYELGSTENAQIKDVLPSHHNQGPFLFVLKVLSSQRGLSRCQDG